MYIAVKTDEFGNRYVDINQQLDWILVDIALESVDTYLKESCDG